MFLGAFTAMSAFNVRCSGVNSRTKANQRSSAVKPEKEKEIVLCKSSS